jgi:glutaconyl-CoA/methylmalonyl-CoA decarboxylase subunit gamma
MKKLRITVNQTVYDVTVQLLEDDEQMVTGAGYVSPLPQAPLLGRPAAPPTPPLAGAPSRPSPSHGDEVNSILAPIAGTVQKVFVETGKRIEAKSPAFLLDAMKMDTYIYAPRSGQVSEVAVAVGDSVQVGQLLMRYKPEE